MAFLVCHMAKHGSGAVGGLQSHVERERESKSNPDIDYNRTDDNYSLVECDNYRKAIQGNISELKLDRAVRKDAVLTCSFVVTSSQDFFKDKSPEETKAFFTETVEFFKDRYGAQNVISAKVHMDEATPHLHLLLTPIKDGKLSAKTMFDRVELRGLQTDLHASVGLQRGLERGKEGSSKGHLSENRYKAEKAIEAARAAEQKLAALTPKLLKAEEVERLQGKKTLIGNALKNVSYTDFVSLKETAAHVEEVAGAVAAANRRVDLAERAADSARKELQAERVNIAQERQTLEQERSVVAKAMQETPAKALLQRNQELSAENYTLKGTVQAIASLFKYSGNAIKAALSNDKPALDKIARIETAVEQDKSRSRTIER